MVALDDVRRRLPRGRPGWSSTGLNRFAVAQVLSGAGDALVAVSLAGSLFFSLSPEASQEQVLIYLVINLAPYALLAPLVGPAIDRLRHGPRNICTFLFGLRAVCAVGLALSLYELGLYFFALALLIAAKATGVARQALVPGLVDDPTDLVAANSRLARLSVVAGAVGGALGAGVLAVTSPAVAATLAGGLFLASAVATARVPDPRRMAPVVAPLVTYEELHRPTIVATGWAFAAVRASVGFFVFGLAFALRRESEPAWMYAVSVGAYGVGAFAGSVLAPILRRRSGEERLTAGALVVLAVVAAFGALGSSRPLVIVVGVVLGGAATVARQGFDAMVQRHVPPSSHGRVFARFETRFQLAWVIGAIGATAIGAPIQVSLTVVAVGLVPAAVRYVRALREAQQAHAEDPFDPVEVARGRLDHAAEWHRREEDRLALTEVSSVVDLARATGMPLAAETVARLDELRQVALSTSTLDPREVSWAIERAGELVDRLERRARGDAAVRRGAGQPPTTEVDHPEVPSASSETSIVDRSSAER